MARIKLTDLIKWIRLLLPLLSLPDWKNAEDTRQWVLRLLGAADEMADETSTSVDDQAVEALMAIAGNVDAWETLHGLLLDLVTDDAGNLENDNRITLLADDAKIDPAVILVIIQAVMQIIQWWKSRDEADATPPENLD